MVFFFFFFFLTIFIWGGRGGEATINLEYDVLVVLSSLNLRDQANVQMCI